MVVKRKVSSATRCQGTRLDRATVIPVRYHLCMAMTLRLPDDLDAKLTERARREGRSKQELAIEAIREAQDRAELKVDDVLAELMDSDAEILDYLK
ncbi:putative transcriptional regulator [Streptomyces sp. SAI-129]